MYNDGLPKDTIYIVWITKFETIDTLYDVISV
mgnify:CR=1 FL=1